MIYELTNHLGNLVPTITDKKVWAASASNSSLTGYYTADLASATDAYSE
jgi:hypothetical protein